MQMRAQGYKLMGFLDGVLTVNYLEYIINKRKTDLEILNARKENSRDKIKELLLVELAESIGS